MSDLPNISLSQEVHAHRKEERTRRISPRVVHSQQPFITEDAEKAMTGCLRKTGHLHNLVKSQRFSGADCHNLKELDRSKD
jgi:hypothetical protein